MMFLKIRGLSLQGVRILKFGPSLIQTASLTGRTSRGEPLVLPKPFPYEDKRLFEWIPRMDTMYNVSQENAKVIVVEGPIAVGKSAFCKLLAEEFDMLYMPQPTMDAFYKLPSGYDLRQHDDELPEEVRSYDHKNFCIKPKCAKAARFQFDMYRLKYLQYLDAMCHILNTGQGVVLERSFYSDYVFMKAMLENGYISKEVAKGYMTIKKNSSTLFMRPHIIIYLDIPVPVVQERIRTRNYSYEQNSPALTDKYLASLEKYWKQDYLTSARSNSEVLIYDWSEGGYVDVVVSDLEELDLDIMRSDSRFVDWWLPRKLLFEKRVMYTNYRTDFEKYLDHPLYRIDEFCIPPHEVMKWHEMMHRIPENHYDFGYNRTMGDSILKILFKGSTDKHRHPKYHLNYLSLERVSRKNIKASGEIVSYKYDEYCLYGVCVAGQPFPLCNKTQWKRE